MIYSRIKSKINGNKALFDAQTQLTTNNKFDLVINPQGQLNRVIGIDKLAQHLLKYIFIEKGSYGDPEIGTNIASSTIVKDAEFTVKSDILTTLSRYSAYQIENSKIDTSILGWFVYRTQTPEVSGSWIKLNKYLIANNFYYDEKNLLTNELYYYSVVAVRNIAGKPTTESIGKYLPVQLPQTDTLNAVIGGNFIIIPEYKAVTLYWKRPVAYHPEEVLRSITKLDVYSVPGEPRNLKIYMQLTNLMKQTSTITSSIFTL